MTQPPNDLEALALAYAKEFYGENFDPHMNPEAFDLAYKATAAVLTALRAQDAVPVAWILRHPERDIPELHFERQLGEAYIGWTETPLFASPAPQAVAADGELEICPNCDGSGEGVADTTCNLCNGLGGVPKAVEPVGYLYRDGHEELFIRGRIRELMVAEGWGYEPVYTHPSPNPAPQAVEGVNLKARIWERDNEWVLEIEGAANDTYFVSRHTEPLTTPLEDVAGLPSLYTRNGDKDAVIAELEREHGYHPNHGVPSMNAKIEQRHRQRLVELLNGLHGLGVLYNIALQLIANADAAARVYLEDHRKVGPHIIRLRCPDDTETKETEK